MSSIWFKEYNLDELNVIFEKNMTGFLGIKATELTENSITATMPVNEKTKQPFGLLHGGASVVLAESVGSIASNMVVNDEKYMGVGLEINANHIRSATDKEVTAVCSPLHIGATTHVWDIRINNHRGQLLCISRLTVAIVPKR
ncbi:hotdog fold thioesterase [Sphingobacterium spiritivorum]|uniref:hotdog fold thioesterase n=1 Tax=Sphingobacterium TaxID=28453 RepID=UPI0025D52C7A|nr:MULTISPECIES: hotdog fold thioesterase [unclassified Sphingobacterium]